MNFYLNYLKKPMTAVLTIGLGQIKAFYTSWISFKLVFEKLSVVIQIPGIKSQSYIRNTSIELP